VQRRTVDGLLYLIERERNGETVDRSLIKSLLRMYGALGVYAEVFERPFLEATRTFYAREGEARMQEYDVAEYLRHVEARLQEEQERVLHYLDATTRRPLQQTLERYLLEAHVQALVEKGLNQLLREDRRADLARMYALFARVGALEKLRSGWNAYIKATGRELVLDTSPERERGLVEELLEFKARLDRVLEQSFARNDAFAYSLKEAFESFINARPNKPAELIAKFVDSKLRRGGSGSGKQALSEAELEAVLDRVMILFRYVQGKDVFEAFYKKDLAKRLLLGRSVSIEAEKSMISRLKAECGQNFTNKLEGMFKDIDLSRELTAQFRAWPRLQELAPRRTLEMHISVLTTGYWPNYPLLELKLPAQLQELQELFREFYQSKHSGRRLQWVHALAQCTLKAQFARGRKELSLSLVQACVLLLFNTAPGALSYQEIAAATGLEEKELKRTLASLALGKVRVLTRCQGSGSGPIQEEDSFRVNDDLTHKLFRIKINAAQLAETPEEAQKTHETVFADRQYQVDAAIVRIMKTRKSLSHAQLVAELYKQLRFPCKPADIKKRIESLIEREYLERDAQNHQQYNYLA
jgi:cullin-4